MAMREHKGILPMIFRPKVYTYVKEVNGWTIQRITSGAGYRLAYYDDALARVPSITVEGCMHTLQDAEDRARDIPPCDCG